LDKSLSHTPESSLVLYQFINFFFPKLHGFSTERYVYFLAVLQAKAFYLKSNLLEKPYRCFIAFGNKYTWWAVSAKRLTVGVSE